MHIMRMITRLPAGLVRGLIGLAAAVVAVIGITGMKKRGAPPRGAGTGKKERS
jgi:hypothetical protein